MKTPIWSRNVLIGVLLAASLAAVALGQESPPQTAQSALMPLATRLPEHVIAFAGASGTDALAEQLDATILGQICDDPQARQFASQCLTALQQVIARETGESDRIAQAFDTFQLCLTRPCAIALLPPPDNSGPIFMLAIETGPRRPQFEQKIASLFKFEPHHQLELAGLPVYADHHMRQAHAYLAWLQDTLVLAINDPQGHALTCLAHDAGTSNPKTWIIQLQNLNDAGDLFAYYISVPRSLALIPENKPKTAALLATLGFDGIEYLTGRLGTDGPNLAYHEFLACPAPRRGLLDCLQPVPYDHLRYALPDVVSATLIRPNLPCLYDTIIDAIEQTIDADDAAQMHRKIATAQQNLGFQIRDGLLNSLEGPILAYSISPNVSSYAPQGGFAVVCPIGDAAPLVQALAALKQLVLEQGQRFVQVTYVELDGHTYESYMILPMVMMGLQPSWTIDADSFVLGSSPAVANIAVTQLLAAKNGENAGLAARQNLRLLWQQNNSSNHVLHFEYTDTRSAWQQNLAAMQMAWPMLVMGLQHEAINLPMVLPQLGKYIQQMGDSYSITWTDETGIHCRAAGPAPNPNALAIAGAAGMGLTIALPALSAARQQAQTVVCASQLKGIANAINMYRCDFKDKNPPHLQDLIDYEDLSPKTFLCPSANEKPGQSSYIYRGGDLTGVEPADMILLYDKQPLHNGARNVLFNDLRVERLEEPQFQKALQRDNECRRKRNLEQIPAYPKVPQPQLHYPDQSLPTTAHENQP